MSKYFLNVVAIVLLTAVGCQWDTPHDNPFDPKFPPAPLSNVSIQILDLALNPIDSASVVLRELDLDRSRTTDSLGWAYFDEIPVGEVFWVVAFRENGELPKYARDSIQVSGSVNETTINRITLDALPNFTAVSVNSLHNRTDDASEFKIRLKVEVDDADGLIDIRSISWRFKEMTGNLHWHPDPDSSFYEVEIPSADFGGIGDALTAPFYFEATDLAQNSTNTEASLIRIINGYPRGSDTFWTETLLIEWDFFIQDDFPDGGLFHYLLRIDKRNIDGTREVLYKEVIPSMDRSISHDVEGIPEPKGIPHDYFVWVVDEFGNFARSKSWTITEF